MTTTLGNLIHDCAMRFAGRPAIIMAETGEVLRYGELEILINRFAHGFRRRFDCAYVSIMLENSPQYLSASYGLKKINIVEVAINRAFRGAALARMINLAGSPALITSQSHFDALDGIMPQLTHLKTLILTDGIDEARRRFPNLEIIAFDALLADDATHIASTAADTDPAVIMFTSGTTGPSKGCVLSHRYGVRTAENVIPPFRVGGDDIVYAPYPLSHIGPAFYDILPTLMTGGAVLLRDGFSLSRFWPEVARYGVTWFMCLGSVQQLLYAAEPSPLDRKHKVTRCWATPAPVPKRDFDVRFGLHLIPGGGYGSTDAGWVVAPQWNHAGGVVLPHFEVRICDDDGAPLPAGEKGEMVIRPREPGIMADGYFGAPERTRAAWRDGWFLTGDIGFMDDAGLFYFSHRKAERIRVRGEMVSGFEVEEAVLAHPAIEDAAAIGIPAAMGEEDIMLFVTLKPGAVLDADAIRKHCRARMAKFMVSAHITILDDMPRTPTGKPEKGRLAEIAAASRDSEA